MSEIIWSYWCSIIGDSSTGRSHISDYINRLVSHFFRGGEVRRWVRWWGEVRWGEVRWRWRWRWGEVRWGDEPKCKADKYISHNCMSFLPLRCGERRGEVRGGACSPWCFVLFYLINGKDKWTGFHGNISLGQRQHWDDSSWLCFSCLYFHKVSFFSPSSFSGSHRSSLLILSCSLRHAAWSLRI